MFKPGDYIRCAGEQDTWRVVNELVRRGYHFNADFRDFSITITAVPEVSNEK